MVGQAAHFNGTLVYNDFVFPAAMKATVAIRPILDRSKRFTKYNTYTLTAECVLHDDVDQFDPQENSPFTNQNQLFNDSSETVDGDDGLTTRTKGVTALRRLLTAQGAPLEFTGKGLGLDFEINTFAAGTRGDLLYGPIPKMLIWEPLGASKAVRIVWTVEVSIADCKGIVTPFGRVAEYTTNLSWSIDSHGLTTRSITGTIEVVQKILGATTNRPRRNENSADLFVEAVTPFVPGGFRRITNTHSLNAGRNVLSFTFVDQEIPSDNPYGTGIVNANVNASVRNEVPLAFNKWICTVSGSISVSKSHDRWWAWLAFLSVVQGRLDAFKNAKFQQQKNRKGKKSSSGGEQISVETYMVLRLSITEEVFGRGMRFSVTWRLTSSLQTLIKSSGLWTRNTSTAFDSRGFKNNPFSWSNHFASMQLPWRGRGTQGIRHVLSEDTILNVCGNQRPFTSRLGEVLPANFLATTVFKSTCPKDSYYDFEQYFEELVSPGAAVMVPLGGESPDRDGVQTFAGDNDDHENFAYKEVAEPVIQVRHKTHIRVRYWGSVKRIGKRPVMSTLNTFAGAKVLQELDGSTHGFHRFIKSDSSGCSHYFMWWDMLYELDKAPDGDVLNETSPDGLDWPT